MLAIEGHLLSRDTFKRISDVVEGNIQALRNVYMFPYTLPKDRLQTILKINLNHRGASNTAASDIGNKPTSEIVEPTPSKKSSSGGGEKNIDPKQWFKKKGK